MKLKKIIPHILVFTFSFFVTPLIITSTIKMANNNAKDYIQHFTPNTSSLSNGNYQGNFKLFKILSFAKVEFEIENGKVKNIDFKRMYHSPGNPSKEEIEKQIRQRQQLEVNAISGATRTSNFAKAAIKNALEGQSIK